MLFKKIKGGKKMAIRYDPGYNKEIRNVVRNFNRKRNRAYARGFRDLPDLVKVSDLKARYSSREDLNKQLTMLKRFSSGGNEILKAIENSCVSIKKQDLKECEELFTDIDISFLLF